MPDVEIDFPRGGAPISAPLKKPTEKSFSNKRKFASENESKLPTKKAVATKNDDEDSVYAKVFRRVFTVDLFTEDLRGLGCIKEIHDTNVLLESVEGIQVTVNCNQISRKFNEILAKKEISFTLEDIFKIGQFFAFKVIKEAAKEGPRHLRKPEVSIDPSAVNSHLLSASLKNGLVINGTVMSIEEKGAVIDLGLPSKINGFVSNDDLPSYLALNKLHVGQVILFRVKGDSGESTRVIKLSAYPEMDTFEDEKLNLNNLMPGTILHASPEKVVGDGVFVGFKNDLKAFLWKIHLPPRLRLDISRFAKSLRVTVLCCMPNSNILAVSAHPDIVSLSKPERRLVAQPYKIGEKVTCTVYGLDKQGNVLFTIEEADGKPSLLTAKMFRVMIDDYEKNIKKFTPGSEHNCRIIAYHSIERLLIVSTKKEVLKQKILSSEHAKPGQKVTATIAEIKPAGLLVELGEDLRGLVPKMHVLDRETSVWAKHFKHGQKLQCRVLFVNQETNKIILTAKTSIVNSTEKIITEYSDSLVGAIAIGVVVKQHDDGGLVITFFNRVGGFLREAEVKKLTSFEIGMPLKVRIEAVDVERERMVLSLGGENESKFIPQTSQEKNKSTDDKKSKKEIKTTLLKKSKPAKIFQIYTATIVGKWPYGGCSPDTAVELNLKGSVGRLHASELDLSHYEEGSVPIREFLKKYSGKSINVKVIQVGNHKMISKPGKNKLMEEKGTHRFVECTINPEKLKETRKKQSIVGYQEKFVHGSNLPVFLTKFSGRGNAKLVSGEISPSFYALVPRERLNKIIPNPIEKPIQSMIDLDFEEGELAIGRVIGINKAVKTRYLQLSLVQAESPEFGAKILGRVDTIQESPLKIGFGLANGQKGVLTPTGILNDFKSADELQSYFGYNQLFNLIVWSYDESSSEWNLITQERFKSLSKKSNPNPLIRSISEEIKSGLSLRGYVRSITEVGIFVEISPGVLGRLKSEENFVINDLILVDVINVSEDKIKLLYKEHICRATEDSVVKRRSKRQRTLSLESNSSLTTAEKKSRAAGYTIAIVQSPTKAKKEHEKSLERKPEIHDPGFDWSLKGFSMEEMAAVGREDKEKAEYERKNMLKQEDGGENIEESAKFITLDDLLVEKEKLIFGREQEIHDTDSPQSETDFDRLVTGNPNSSNLWIKYMAFFLQKNDPDKARFIAERALDVIHFREEAERQNIWTAYLNLDVITGTPESLKEIFERATKNCDSLKMHKQLAKIYANKKMNEELDELYQTMLKKFRHEDLEVWFMYGQFLLENGHATKARDLLQRALQSLPKTQHLAVLSRFASMEYKFGDIERGKTMFEKILETYPKKIHIWTLYIDMVVKFENLDEARRIFERAASSSNLGGHKMRNIFKKWLEIEEKFGDEDSLKMVKQRAVQYIDSLKEEDSDKE